MYAEMSIRFVNIPNANLTEGIRSGHNIHCCA